MNTYEVFSASLEVPSRTVQAIAPILKFLQELPEMHNPVGISSNAEMLWTGL